MKRLLSNHRHYTQCSEFRLLMQYPMLYNKFLSILHEADINNSCLSVQLPVQMTLSVCLVLPLDFFFLILNNLFFTAGQILSLLPLFIEASTQINLISISDEQIWQKTRKKTSLTGINTVRNILKSLALNYLRIWEGTTYSFRYLLPKHLAMWLPSSAAWRRRECILLHFLTGKD